MSSPLISTSCRLLHTIIGRSCNLAAYPFALPGTQKNNNGASHARAVVVSDDSDSDDQHGSDDGSQGEEDGDGLNGGTGDEEDEDDFIVEDDGHVDLPGESPNYLVLLRQASSTDG